MCSEPLKVTSTWLPYDRIAEKFASSQIPLPISSEIRPSRSSFMHFGFRTLIHAPQVAFGASRESPHQGLPDVAHRSPSRPKGQQADSFSAQGAVFLAGISLGEQCAICLKGVRRGN